MTHPNGMKKSEFILDCWIGDDGEYRWATFYNDAKSDFYPTREAAAKRAEAVLEKSPEAPIRIRNYWGAVVWSINVDDKGNPKCKES